MTTKIKIFNNSTNIKDMFLDLMYSDSPVKYIVPLLLKDNPGKYLK